MSDKKESKTSEQKDFKANPYIQQATSLLEEAKKFRVMSNVGSYDKQKLAWDHVLTKRGCNLYKRSRTEVSSFPCYLVETVINKPKDVLVNKIWAVNEEGAKKNDPKLLMWNEVEKDVSWKVCSQYSGMTWPTWPRHLVFAQTRFDDGDKTYLVAHSVDHDSVKVDTKTHVKGLVHMSVYEFKDNGDGSTSIWRITQVDPCGWIPVSIVEMYAGNLVDMFNRWRDE